MVLDTIENADSYTGLGERLAQGLKLIQDPSLLDKKDGTYEVDGENLFYMVQRYSTQSREEKLFEAHQQYIDIQAVIRGRESIVWAPVETMEITQPYTPDMSKGTVPNDFTELNLPEGTFAIFFPEDAHKPGCHLENENKVIKIVVKVKI